MILKMDYEKSFKDMEINQIRKSSGNETNMSLISKRGVSNNWWERLGDFFVTNKDKNGYFLKDIIFSSQIQNNANETREEAIKKLLQQNYINMDNWAIKEVDGQGDLYTGSRLITGATGPTCKCQGKIGTYTRGCDLSNVQLKAIGSNKNFDDDDVNDVNTYEKFFNILNGDCDGVNSLKCISYGDIENIDIEFNGYYDKGWAFQNCGNYSFDNLNLKTGEFKMIANDLSCNMGSEYKGDTANLTMITTGGTINFDGCQQCPLDKQKTNFKKKKCVINYIGEGCT